MAPLSAPPAATSDQTAPANPAGEMFLRQMASGTPLTAAALTGTGGRPHMAGDDTFELARRLDASERVLIYDRIAANKRSTFILMGGFIVFLSLFFLAIGYYLSYYGGVAPGEELNMSIRIGVAGFLIALAIGMTMYFTAPAAVLMISGAHEVTKQEEPELNLTIGSGLPMPKVYVIEDSAPNALATGRDPQHAYVAATRGLLNKLEKRELEAVMAHEMSHVGNYDIRIMTMIAVAVGLIAMIADLLLRFTWYGSGARSSNRDKGGGAIALLLLAAAFILIVVSPIVASMIRLALSRQREYLADASGALLCRNPDALADALEKISADTEPLEVANKATAHMYIENPLKEHGSFLNNLFATHPPAQERIRLLRAMA
jgi:heat shock protein HtpX